MQITITTKKTAYLNKKYGDAQGIVQQVFDNWFNSEIDREYEKKIKIDTDKKIDEINKIK